jgi:5-guanidino-2-oxopentanoate decarboxylase
VFPEDDALALGVALGYPAGRAALAECDVVVAIGTELSSVDLENVELQIPGRVIRIDIDRAQLQMNLHADCEIQADAKAAIEALLNRLKPRAAGGAAERVARARVPLDAEIRGRAGPAWTIGESIRTCLDEDTVVSCDTSMLCYNAIIPARFANKAHTCLNPTGYATLGYALPAGIGAKLSQPDRRVIVLAGDGGILFTLSELAMAVDNNLRLPIVVVNNRGYGEIRQAMIARDIEPFGVTFTPPRFELIADAFGARGATVTEPAALELAIREAFEASGPTLIEAIL